MKKSISSLTSSSGFSLVGASMIDDDHDDFGMSSSTSFTNGNRKAKPDTEKRGWDWRLEVKGGSTGEDVLRFLRRGLAKEVARAWLDGQKM